MSGIAKNTDIDKAIVDARAVRDALKRVVDAGGDVSHDDIMHAMTRAAIILNRRVIPALKLTLEKD